MPKIWYKQVYVKGFDCESILVKKTINISESMDIIESI